MLPKYQYKYLAVKSIREELGAMTSLPVKSKNNSRWEEGYSIKTGAGFVETEGSS